MFIDQTAVPGFSPMFGGLSGANLSMKVIVFVNEDGDLSFCIPESVVSGHAGGVSSNRTDELGVPTSTLFNVYTSTHGFYRVTYGVVLWSQKRPNSLKPISS